MKAVRFHEYGLAGILRIDDIADPVTPSGHVLVRMAATSVNPIDIRIRSGALRDRITLDLPAIPGVDVAGTVIAVGTGVTALRQGDRVLGMASQTYAELCVARTDQLAIIPAGLEFGDAATLPCVSLTGDQLVMQAARARFGQTILITGALGAVGRCAVFAAGQVGCRIIAGVRRNHCDEAAALPGVDTVVALDEDAAIAAMEQVDCIADTVGGPTAFKVIAQVRDHGVFGTVIQDGQGNSRIEVNAIVARPDATTLARYARAAHAGDLILPRGLTLPLGAAAQAHAIVEAGGSGKVVLQCDH